MSAAISTSRPGTLPGLKGGFDYEGSRIGAGSAGCVLAARLSEDAAVQVALIEAGPIDDAPEVHTPVAFSQLFKSEFDWDYSSEPEPALLGRRLYLPRGKVPSHAAAAPVAAERVLGDGFRTRCHLAGKKIQNPGGSGCFHSRVSRAR